MNGESLSATLGKGEPAEPVAEQFAPLMRSPASPGPWHVMAGMPTNVLDDRGIRVARCDFDGVPDGPHAAEMHANARLIASAPERLSACMRLEAAYRHYEEVQKGSRSVFIKDTGRFGKSSWAELIEAIEAAIKVTHI